MKKMAVALFAGATLLALVPGAQAATTTYTTCGFSGCSLNVTEGSPTPNETNIYFNSATNVNTGTGQVGSQTGTDQFSFTDTLETLTFTEGFANIDQYTPNNSGGAIHELDIKSTTGMLWNDMVFAAQGLSGTAPTDLSIAAYLAGTLLGTIDIGDIGSGADSFLTFIINAGVMDELKLTSTAGLHELKQFEVSQVPIPPASLLFGTALIGITLLARSKRRLSSPKLA